MAWVLLATAIAFEVFGTTCLKLSEGFSRLVPSLLIVPAYAASFTLLTFAVKTIPISVAYAVWSALGTAIIAAIGTLWFREPWGTLKAVSLGLIIIGVVGVHLADRLAIARG
jgi:small multidrug resistance pump